MIWVDMKGCFHCCGVEIINQFLTKNTWRDFTQILFFKGLFDPRSVFRSGRVFLVWLEFIINFCKSIF
jgi:hypothetical protein